MFACYLFCSVIVSKRSYKYYVIVLFCNVVISTKSMNAIFNCMTCLISTCYGQFFQSISRLHKLHKYRHILNPIHITSFFLQNIIKMSESGDAEGPWPSGKLQLFELERSLLHSGRMQAVRRAAAAAFSMQSPQSPPPCAAVVVVVPPVLSFFLPWNDCANAAVEMQGGPCRPPHSTVSKSQ